LAAKLAKHGVRHRATTAIGEGFVRSGSTTVSVGKYFYKKPLKYYLMVPISKGPKMRW